VVSYKLELVNISEEDKYDTLNCGVPVINNYLVNGDAYYEHIMKLTNTKLIKIGGSIVGYFTMQFKIIVMAEDDKRYPCIYLKYLCTDKEFQKKGIGTKTLDFIVLNSKNLSDFVGCRCLLIDAITDKIEWYRTRGFDFLEDDDNIDLQNPTVEMFIDFRDNELVDGYFEI